MGRSRKGCLGKLTLGFIPLTDCAPLVVAKRRVLCRRDWTLNFSRESSWANIRDKVCTGILDGAQMLAAMPLATGLDNRHCQPMVTAMSLDLNGNAITVSKGCWADAGHRYRWAGYGYGIGPGAEAGSSRTAWRHGRKRLAFAMVFPESSHNYLVALLDGRCAGIDPDEDVDLTVVPPPQDRALPRAGLIVGMRR